MKSASGPLSLRMSSSFLEMSSYAWSQETRFHFPPSSFIGYFRRCDSCVMPCSRTDAPFAQCAPRLSGESNTGSWRTHTPSCVTASIEQPTEQCVHTVRFTSSLPASPLASARPIMLNGICDTTAPAPALRPVRLRKVRRSIVLASTPDNPRARRGCGAALLVALRVNSMAVSSDLGRAVVVAHVLARLIAARCTLVVRCRSRLGGWRLTRHDRGGGGDSASPGSQKEVTTGQSLRALAHDCRLLLVILCAFKFEPILEHFKSGLLQ